MRRKHDTSPREASRTGLRSGSTRRPGGNDHGVGDVPGSAKLVRLTVDFGDHRRTILAGLKKERANPREIQNRQALFVVNLEPRRMAGEESQEMLLDIGYADGITPVLAIPEEKVPDGTRAG